MLHISNDVNDTCALPHGKSGKQVVVVVFGVPVNILWDGRALRVKPAEVGGEGRYRARTSFSLCFFCSVVLEGGGWVYLILAAKGGRGVYARKRLLEGILGDPRSWQPAGICIDPVSDMYGMD